MRIARAEYLGEVRALVGDGAQWRDVTDLASDLGVDLMARLAGPENVQRAAELASRAPVRDESEIRFLPPIQNPRKILCVGKNYAAHAQETGTEVPAEPLIFSKLPTTLTGHRAEIVVPKESHRIDYEAELVVVIGKPGRHIAEEAAWDYVAGYCCGNDVSARDWQSHKPGGQWLLGKSFDTFAPLGPCVVSRDEVPDPHRLAIELRLNGQVMQQDNTENMVFSIPQLIAYISQVCTLEAGDLLFTGTPEGVGFARRPPVYLKAGDEVEVRIEGVGTLQNKVIGPLP